ncbi:MAG: mycothiol synthase [Terrimesophilobacter sp.]
MPSPLVPDWVAGLTERAARTDGQPPFSDQSLIDLGEGHRELIALGMDAAAIVSSDAAEAEFVVDPAARRRGLGGQLLITLLARSGGTLRVWAHGDHPAARILAARHGLAPVRTLLQLRAQVPFALRDAGSPLARSSGTELQDGEAVPEERAPASVSKAVPEERAPASVSKAADAPQGPRVAPFRPGTDDAAWLAVNAAAFASHPEQGKLTQGDLDARKAEDWFDADDFLLLWSMDARELVGFCWLKVEGDLGEFYAVGIAPGRQGEGLGRVLVEAGFARLAARGIRTSNLYVEADNEPALRLYRSFGFDDYTADVQYATSGILGATG